jgi:hypothetical protein
VNCENRRDTDAAAEGSRSRAATNHVRYSLRGLVIGDLHSLTTPMDPQPPEPKGLISSWDENDVQLFFANLGLPQYEANVKG